MGAAYWFAIGRITALLPSGLGYLELVGENRTRPFIVGQALRGYTGADYAEFGLNEGISVFVALNDSSVAQIVPVSELAPHCAISEFDDLLLQALDEEKRGLRDYPNGDLAHLSAMFEEWRIRTIDAPVMAERKSVASVC